MAKHPMTVAIGLGPAPGHMTKSDDDDVYDESSVSDEEKEAAEDVKKALDGGDGETIALALKHFWDLCEKEEDKGDDEAPEEGKGY